MNNHKDIRDFLFRGLMFESEAANFQAAGIRIGADPGRIEDQLLDDVLAPFGIGLRRQAIEMARLYRVVHCFENDLREYIRGTLMENEGVEWWSKIPDRIRKHAESRQANSQKNSWLEGEKTDLLGFVDFGMLADIIVDKWTHFGNVIPSQHWLKQRMDELEQTRNFIAHNRMLLPSEFQRIYLYIADWNRILGQ